MNNPWKDIAPYKTSDAANFRGRDEDIRKFSKILRQSDFSVLYAESGIGKTSFINAGIMPAFIDTDYYFIRVEFPLEVLAATDDASDENLIANIERWLCNKIFPDAPNEGNLIKGELLQDLSEIAQTANELQHNLWWKLHAYKYKIGEREVKPFIIFDQFEEVFQKSSPSLLHKLFAVLDSISSRIPPKVVLERLYELEEQGIYVSLDGTIDFKVLFSLRKEYLAEFDYWTNDLYSNSQLLQSRMILLPFTKEQAEEVITQQQIEGEQVTTLVDIKDEILNLFEQRTTYGKVTNIPNKCSYEAFLLSVVCSRLYTEATTLQKERLAKEDMAKINLTELILTFYNESIGDSIPKRHLKIIEEELVDNSGERNRIKLTTDNLLAIKFQERYLTELKKRHIVKSSDGYVELIHDRLAEAVFYKRKEQSKKQWFKLQRVIVAALIVLFTGIAFSLAWSTYNSRTSYLSRGIIEKEELRIPEDGKWITNMTSTERVVLDNDMHDTIMVSDCSNLTNIEIRGRKPRASYLNINNCPQLASLSISDSITFLADFDIDHCPNLHFIRLPKNIKQIEGYSSFWGTDSIEFEIPESAKDKFAWESKILWDLKQKDIVYAQEGADSMALFPKELEELDSLKYRGGSGGWSYRIFRNAKNAKPRINTKGNTIVRVEMYNNTSIDLSDSIGITKIGKGAFSGNKYLQEIILPPNLEDIEEAAFAGCSSLRKIEFPQSLTDIDDAAFFGCKGLKEIILPDSLSYFGNYAFSGCTSLQKVQLPKTIQNISQHATQFDGCDYLCNFVLHKNGQFTKRAGIIFRENEPLFFTEKQINYNDSTIRTEDDILIYSYISESSFFYNGKEVKNNNGIPIRQGVYANNGKHHISFMQIRGYNTSQNPIVHNPDSVEFIPPFKGSISFAGIHKLRELHIANTHPRYNVMRLPDVIKENITLYVPYGCKKYFTTDAFASFKEIREDSMFLRIKNILHEMLHISLGQSKTLYMICVGVIAVAFILIYVFYRKRYKKEHQREKISAVMLNSKSLLGTISTLGIFLLTWMAIYWTLYFSLESLNGYIAMTTGHIVGIIVAGFFTWILVYARNANVWMVTKNGLRQLIANIRALTIADVKRFIKKSVSTLIQLIKKWHKVILFLILIGGLIGGYIHKSRLWSDAIDKAEQMKLNALDNATIESFLYNSMPRWKFLLSEKQQNDLRAIYEKIASEIPNVKEIKKYSRKGHNNSVNSVAFSSDGKKVVTGSYDNTAIIWNAETGDTIRTLRGPRGDVTSVAFSSDGKKVVAGSWETAIIWNAETGDTIRTLRGHRYRVNSVAFSPNSSMIVTGSNDSTAIIWNAETGDTIRTLRGHKGGVRSVAFSRDSKTIVTSSVDGLVIIWDAETINSICSWEAPQAVNFVSFTFDNNIILSSWENIVLADWKMKKPTWVNRCGNSQITQVSHDLRYVMDKYKDVYSIETGQLLYNLRCGTNRVYFSSEKDVYFVVGDEYIQKVRPMSLGEWIEKCHQALNEKSKQEDGN